MCLKYMKSGTKYLLPVLFLLACYPYKSYQQNLREPEKITKLRLSNGNFITTPQRIE